MTESAESRAGGRHRGREVALQVLYAIDLGETGPRDARAARAGREPAVGPSSDAANGFVSSRVASAADPTPPELDSDPGGRDAFDRITEHFVVPGSAIEFARELVKSVASNAAELDEIVGKHARNWRVSRMAAVDRNVLRLAVYELRDTATPVAVVIDEAVDLARRFGSDSSPSFVNGVLDAVAREVRAA